MKCFNYLKVSGTKTDEDDFISNHQNFSFQIDVPIVESIDNCMSFWGCKRDAYDIYSIKKGFVFTTDWYPPEQWFYSLDYPNLKIDMISRIYEERHDYHNY